MYENGLKPDGLWSFSLSGDNLDSCPSSDNCCVTPNKPLSLTLIITQIMSKQTEKQYTVAYDVCAQGRSKTNGV